MTETKRANIHQTLLNRCCLLFLFLLFPASTAGILFPAKISEKDFIFSSPLVVKWQFESKSVIHLTPTTKDGYVYLPLSSGDLVSLKVGDGYLQWKTEIGGDFSASPVADTRGVYIASRTDSPPSTPQIIHATGAIRALSQNTGITLWMRTLHYPLQGSLASSPTTIFGGSADGRIYAFNKATGEVLWMAQHTGAFASIPVLHNHRLYIGSEDGTLLALDELTGAAVWRYRTRGALRSPVAVSGSTIYFGSADAYVYAFSENSGRLLWRRRTGAAVQAVVQTNHGLLVTSLDNFVYLLSPRRGELIWKRQLAGRIAAIPLVDEQSALFAPLGGDACIVLSLRDGKQLNTLPVGEDGNTSASSVVADNLLLIPTRRGLTAFAPSSLDAQP